MARNAASRKRLFPTEADPVPSPCATGAASPVVPLTPAVMYTRVSSQDQAKEGFSIPAQQKLLREYAESRGLRIIEEFVDVETAKRAGRANFGKMSDWLRKNPKSCRVIIVEKTDRLYRNVKDWVELDGLNLEIHLVKENVVLSDDSRSHEKFIHGIKVLMAKNFIDNLSEEAKKGLAEKAQQGIWPSRAPLGYLNVVRADGKHVIVPDPDVAPVIQRVFELYASGNYSLVTMTKQARLEGLSFRKSKKALPRTSIHIVLQNLTYTGDFEWHGVRYKGIHEPLITHDTYELVQAVLEGRAKSARHDEARAFLFSGLVQCGPCLAEGETRLLVGEMHKEKYIYYRCEGCLKKKRVVYVREPDIDAHVVKQLRRLRLGDEALAWIREALRSGHDAISRSREEAVNRLNGQIARLQQRIDMAYDDRLDGRIDADLFEHRSRGWRDEQGRCRRELDSYERADQALVEAAPVLLELAKRGFQLYEVQDVANRRRLLQFLAQNFIWSPDALTTVWREPFDILAESTSQPDDAPDGEGTSAANSAKWHGHKDLNLGPADLESAALPTELYPYARRN